jgi:Cu(I)/Ag(I) efflux system membrane fusion protein
MKSFVSVFGLLWAGTVPFASAADKALLHPVNEVAGVEHFQQAGQFKYVCPMHPQIVRDHPGTCPICGMDLVKQVFEQSEQSPQIALGETASSGLKQGLAIRTTQVQKTTLWKYIPTFGRVTLDESKVSHIHPRASGWIRDLSVRTNGEQVKKGQLLYRFYSPEILSAQQDYLLALQNSRSGAESLRMAAKTRLQLLGVDDESIKRISQSKRPLEYVPVYAPQDGVVSALAVQNGMYVQPGTELMSLADLSSVWVEVEVLPLQQDWLRNGLTVNLTNTAFPGLRWEGDIDYLYPQADEKTQAVIARVLLLNADGRLKPNMLMDAEIYGGPKHDVLAIPLEAVIDDGKEKRVVRQLDSGSFDVVKIETGMQTRGVVEIISGLSQGGRVVVSGQFLIDSESQIQSNLRRLMLGDSEGSHAEAAMHSGHAGH